MRAINHQEEKRCWDLCSNLVSSLYDFWSLVKIKDWNQRSPKIPTRYDFVKKGMSGYFYVTVLEWASTSGSPSGRSVGFLCWGDADCQSYQQKPWNLFLLSYSWGFISASLEAVMLLLTDRWQESAILQFKLVPLFWPRLIFLLPAEFSYLKKKKNPFLYKIRHQTVTPSL